MKHFAQQSKSYNEFCFNRFIYVNCCWFTGANRIDVCSKNGNDESKNKNKNGKIDEMDKNIIFSTRNGERTSMRINSFISINDESLKVHHTTQKVNVEANVYSDDSEEGDDIDNESLCDSFYSGTI